MRNILTACVLMAAIPLGAQNFRLSQSNPNGLYDNGETARMVLHHPGYPVDSSCTLRVLKNGFPGEAADLRLGGDSTILFNQAVVSDTSYIFEVQVGKEKCSLGMVMNPQTIRPGFRRPADIDPYWEEQKESLKKQKPVVKRNPVGHGQSGYECVDLEIDCPTTAPVRGYLARPAAAEKGTLPIVINFHAAGVKGDWCKSKPETALVFAAKGDGAISLDMNAHGMLNGQPESYYEQLDSGSLKDYFEKGADNRDSIYFRGMYLRLLRAIEYLTQDPLWDGRRILVIGESQGGGQALAAAGLDQRVSAVVAIVPAMCDWGAEDAGRSAGWPQPMSLKGDDSDKRSTLPYFDVAELLSRSDATLCVEIGLIDPVCPPSAIFAAINEAKGEKIILTAPYRAHHQEQPCYQKEWEADVYSPRIRFIEEYLSGKNQM